MSKRRKVNESVNGGWRGCDEISLISHGSWADPDLYAVIDGMGCYFNYWDIENAIWEDFLEETGHKDSESEDPAVENEFNEYCQKWAYYYMIDCFNNGYFGNPYEKGEYSNGEFCSWRPSDFVEEDVDDYEEDDDLEEGCNKRKKSKKKLKEEYSEEEYRGYVISHGFYGDDDYTVQYCGDDIVCNSREDAMRTIDELVEYDEKNESKKSNTGKKKLSESRGWKIELVSGPALKDAVRNDDMELTLDCLADCWREINEKMPDIYEDDDLEKDLEEIENQRDNLENYDEYGMSYEDVEDEINYLLNEFYDFCDNTRIWVGLD